MIHADDVQEPNLAHVGAILSRQGIVHLTAILSGSGDSGDLDQISFLDATGEELSSFEIEQQLSDLKIMDGSEHSRSFLDHLRDEIYREAEHYGDYCNNEGGVVTLEYDVSKLGLFCAGGSFHENEWDDDPDDEDYDEEPGPG